MTRSTVDRAASVSWRALALGICWLACTICLVLLLASGQHTFEGPATIPALLCGLACTAALLWWMPGQAYPRQAPSRTASLPRFLLASVAAVITLFALTAVLGRSILFVIIVAALVIAVTLRRGVSHRQVILAVSLAVIAAIAALGAGWIQFVPPAMWALMQLGLVTAGLLAGWGLLARLRLTEARIGVSTLLTRGPRPALGALAFGMALGIPWALLNVVVGGSEHDAWVTSLWQPLAAIQPAISEEAWARVFLVPLLAIVLRRWASTRLAVLSSVLIVGYWFSYVHTSGGFGALPSTLLIGTLYSLPLSYLWLRKGLEAAIGFHFWQDFFRFSVALLLNYGVWQ